MSVILISKALRLARVNEGSHSFTCHPHVYLHNGMSHPATPQPKSITTLWRVLISNPTEGRRLSWPGWLGEILRWLPRQKTVAHPSTSCSGRESNLLPSNCKPNTPTTGLPSHVGSIYTPSTILACQVACVNL